MSHTHTHIHTKRISGTLRLSKHRPTVADDSAQAETNLTDTPSTDALDLPHEHDEHVGMTGGVPSPLVQQGARDLKRGIKDTSRSVEANVAYEKLKAS
jgi:hypothetical protein